MKIADGGGGFFQGVLGASVMCLVLCGTPAGLPAGAVPAEKSVQPAERDLDFAQVLSVEVVQSTDGSWCVYATVRHNDEGWDHYAVAWQVRDLEGNELAWRLLAHPHVDEQPFERDKCSVTIPPGVTKIAVQAKCNVHGFGGQEVTVDLTVPEGENFKVLRAR